MGKQTKAGSVSAGKDVRKKPTEQPAPARRCSTTFARCAETSGTRGLKPKTNFNMPKNSLLRCRSQGLPQ